jgi:CheY-like chemotaxis protein/nitrogen-specific signal transduction histidine kinase
VASFQLRQQINQRNGELERANRAKSEFLAMMSHELRTPLNSIIGFSDVLIDGAFGSLNERQGRYVRNVNDSGRHLLRLINDLLDMSKIEAGRLEVMIDRCAPRVLIVDALAALQPLADQKKIHMEVTSLEAPPAVLADPVRLKQVLYNLLSNALKFTPEGGRVTVSFAVLSGGQRVRVTVRDSGPGIADADLAKLFVPFSQLDNARHDPRAGTGLGLALTKQLVELMDGTIYVDNAPDGGGTAFAIELPVASAAPELTSTAPPDAPLVLLVDDDAGARELVQLTLGSHYRLATAGTGEEALVRARELKPDVILLDVFLPGMDGWEVLRALRQNPETRDLPVVLVTISTDRHTSFTLGAVDHLVKPVSSETLLAALARRSLVKRALLGSVRVLVVDDDRRHCELVRAMLEPHGFTVRTELTGAGGIAAARDERFDLMLLDLVMPDLSGVEVVEALREGGKSTDMPIIVLTANQLSAEDRKRLAGSIAAVMAKGATGPDQLVGEIHRVLERK